MGLISPRLILALIVAGVLAMSHIAAFRGGAKSVQAQWNVEKLKQQTLATEESERARKREAELQDVATRLRSQKDAQIKKLRADLDSALDELRQRPERPATYLPSDAKPGNTGCGADQLYREDAEALTRLAADAETTRIALGQCKAQYDAIKLIIDPKDKQ